MWYNQFIHWSGNEKGKSNKQQIESKKIWFHRNGVIHFIPLSYFYCFVAHLAKTLKYFCFALALFFFYCPMLFFSLFVHCVLFSLLKTTDNCNSKSADKYIHIIHIWATHTHTHEWEPMYGLFFIYSLSIFLRKPTQSTHWTHHRNEFGGVKRIYRRSKDIMCMLSIKLWTNDSDQVSTALTMWKRVNWRYKKENIQKLRWSNWKSHETSWIKWRNFIFIWINFHAHHMSMTLSGINLDRFTFAFCSLSSIRVKYSILFCAFDIDIIVHPLHRRGIHTKNIGYIIRSD